MKNNNLFIKNPKKGWIAILVLIFGLFAETAVGQLKTFTWGGATSTNWATATNWATSGNSNALTTAPFISGATSLTLTTANASIDVGDAVSAGTGITVGTTITSIDVTRTIIGLSAPTTGGGSSVTFTFVRNAAANTTNIPDSSTDLVVINKNDTPNAPFITSGSYTVNRVTISNSFGTIGGATLTIDSGGTLNITTASGNSLVLNGGNMVNNGTLTITSATLGSDGFETKGITCGDPTVAPTILNPTTFSYSGSGQLNINLTNTGAFRNSAAVAAITNNIYTTYNILFDGITTINLSSANATYAVRAIRSLIIGGAGFTLGTAPTGVTNGLILLGAQSNVTVNAGTTLTLNSASGNTNNGINWFSGTAAAASFTNNGTINILGSTARNGFSFSTGATANASIMNFSNTATGIINVNINGVASQAALSIGNGGGGTVNASSSVNITNAGTMTLKNTATTVGSGFSIFCIVEAAATPMTISNNGTLNLEGSVNTFANKTTVANSGIINSNCELRNFASITNNVGAVINFVRTAATGTTRQVVFSGLTTASVASLNSTYTDANGNTYSVINQKYSANNETVLVTNVLSSVANTPTSGNLTLASGTGDGTIAFTGFSNSNSVNSALTSTTTNDGTINTDTASNLNIISGVTTSATSIIAPGGSTGKGIADFAKATAVSLTGKTVLQISGNGTAGVDYDKIINSLGGTLTVGGTLDITGIYTPIGPVTIEIVKATGNLAGAFTSVIGTTTGWSVDYDTPGKVQLVYGTTTWTGATSTDWTEATNWSAGVPNADLNAVIASGGNEAIIASNVSIKSLTLNALTSLTVNSGFNLTVTGAVTNSGTMTIQNNANLIQEGITNTNSGNITVKRNSNDLFRLDYTIWSSPVAGQKLLAFSPATLETRFYNYKEDTNKYSVVTSPSTTDFATAAGYLIRMPNTDVTSGYDAGTTSIVYPGVFTGVPNNGDITKAVTYNGSLFGYNMIGNPYPSTINADAFITANTANIESTLYFWRKKDSAAGSAYASYTLLGATTTTPTSPTPNGTIQVGQGFFVKAKSASNVTFTNAMRVANNANQFFKTKQVAQKDRVWLNLTNTAGAFSQALIGYTADAMTGVDMYDAKYINDSPIALTSNINEEEYSIQGRPAFDVSDVVALNFKTDAAGDYTIALDQFDGVFANGQDVYLLDNKTGAETDLKASGYTFTAAVGVDNTRFSLKFQKTLKVDASAFNENSVRVYKNNGTLYVNSGAKAISNIKVYDIQGRLIAEQKNVKANTASMNNLKASNQVLIVKITGEDSSVVTKKVVN